MPLSSLSDRSTPDEFLAKAAWRDGHDRERAEYEASFDRAVAQIDHERTCGQCQKYAVPGRSDRYGTPCAVGRRFHSQTFTSGNPFRIAS